MSPTAGDEGAASDEGAAGRSAPGGENIAPCGRGDGSPNDSRAPESPADALAGAGGGPAGLTRSPGIVLARAGSVTGAAAASGLDAAGLAAGLAAAGLAAAGLAAGLGAVGGRA